MMRKKSRGFTIIEVVLVLAIAGLIFIMVFIAMPALRRNQRDQVRVRNISTMVSLMDSYRAHNNSQLPGTDSKGQACVGDNKSSCNAIESLNKYLDAYAIELEDPTDATGYNFVSAGGYGDGCVAAANEVIEEHDYHHIGFCYETTCGGDNMGEAETFQKAPNKFVFTIIYRKEVGGVICQDNNG